ncbi:MAG: hypothetical protein SFY92_00900 [Verrucomicrobiae bacterium]|nr:hypothetical protein [Verrucomicrobiae bacterium]
MKNPSPQATQTGSSLLLVIGMIAAMSILCVSILSMAGNEYRLSKRSVSWSQAMFSAEAGGEVAFNEINKNTMNMNPGGSTSNWFPTADGWTYTWTGVSSVWTLAETTLSPISGNEQSSSYSVVVSTVPAAKEGTSIYDAATSTNNAIFTNNFTVVAYGNMEIPSVTGTGGNQESVRRIRMILAPIRPNDHWALFAKGGIEIGGNSSVIDSYNSGDGPYNAVSNRTFNGNVGSNGTNIFIIDAGHLDIYGSMQTGDGGTVKTGANFNMLSDPNGTTNSISDGLQRDIPDAALPANFSATPGTFANGGSIGSSNASGTVSDFRTTSEIDKLTITGFSNNTVRVYVSNSINMAGGDYININPVIYTTNIVTAGGSVTTSTNYSTNIVATNIYQTLLYNDLTFGTNNVTNYTYAYVVTWRKNASASKTKSGTSTGTAPYNTATVQASFPYGGDYTIYDSHTVNVQSGPNVTTVFTTTTNQYMTNMLAASYTTNVTPTVSTVTNVTTTTNTVSITNGPPKVEIYVYGPEIDLGGNGIVNSSGRPGWLSIYGLPTVTNVGIGGTSALYAGIYAPSAEVTIHGTADIYGAVTGSTIRSVGNFVIHYDESMNEDKDKVLYYDVSRWEELFEGQ